MPALELVPVAIETRQEARQLYERGVKPGLIARQLNLPPSTISHWAKRGKWQKPIAVPLHVPVKLVKDEPKLMHSHAVKTSLANTLAAQAVALEKETVRVSDLRNGRASQGLAAVAKTIAETAAIVFDWKSDPKPGVLILSGDMPRQTSETQADPGKESLIPDQTPTPRPG